MVRINISSVGRRNLERKCIMSYRLNLKTGKLHASCAWGKRLKEGGYMEFHTAQEAKHEAKKRKLTLTLCAYCKFRESLQAEIE